MRIRGVLTAAMLFVVASATAAASTGAIATTGLSSTERLVAAQPATSIDVGTPPPAGFVAPIARVPRSQRTAPPPPNPAMLAPEFPALTGLIAAPVVLDALGIPEIILNAYRAAELEMMLQKPGCGVSWNLIAGIGRIESGHASGGRTDAVGTTLAPILGPVLDGHLAGNAVITDTDGGLVDGNRLHDRAVGPMQFIPATWAGYASDGNADGIADPHNVFDASLAAARYLCSGDLNLRDPGQLQSAILRYNNSMSYAVTVLSWSEAYARGTTPDTQAIAPHRDSGGSAELLAEGPVGVEQPDPAPATPAPPEGFAAPLTPPNQVPTFPGLPPFPDLSCLLCPPMSQASIPPPGAPPPAG